MWIDISQPLHNHMAHWPGDTPFSYEIAFSKEETGSVNIGKITTSLHTGTHVDAPFHFDNHGEKILELNINIFIGKARMVDVTGVEKIGPSELKNVDLHGVERLLLRTSRQKQPDQFPTEIPSISPDLAPYLHEYGVKLIGVDVPSVDPLDSKEMSAHQALYKHGIMILENIVLHHIEPGDYELIALPLPIKGADGSPVRAVVRRVNTEGM
ncbi:arylformamidase [Aneurinibacillus thermoaerophilus]|uniref:arylformamidase n=1 Tax=Aneurinibacillus TaxID=55079 RepID=UPI00070F13F9|nr:MULTISPECIES: arylformamidase [Aneurinibacillus]AMA73157.1 kynurenine formamidase [Aneurinibacillus sp. XH2]MED0758952.1 arylformamidase [Aneurinibacillus thermoaerophilus]MED0761022.1 arylformamidase [Aneurinibacillus thermoaerophilus]